MVALCWSCCGAIEGNDECDEVSGSLQSGDMLTTHFGAEKLISKLVVTYFTVGGVNGLVDIQDALVHFGGFMGNIIT